MIHWIALLTCLLSFSLYAEYFFCIDGGGSKTILQVMNQEGQISTLMKDGIKNDRIVTTGSNINSVGVDGVRQVLGSLLENVFVVEGDKEIDVNSLIPDSRFIAGMAGAALLQNKQAIISLMEERGIKSDHILLMNDAEMALQLINGEGIILIASTGSICLGKKDDKLVRVGGLGRILGDEGSGYQIGLLALKASIAEEYGWGMPTTLTPALKELFQVSEIKTLIPKINRVEIPASNIAACAPIVFSHAFEQEDPVAAEIIEQAADHLGYLLHTMLEKSQLSNCEVHLWGGIFKNIHSEAFIQKIKERIPEAGRNITIINRSLDNAAILYTAQKILPNNR